MRIMDYYLLIGLAVHIAFLGLVDWLGYHHLVTRGYDHTVLFLALLNVGIGFGLYYLVLCPLRQRVLLRRKARAAKHQFSES